MRVLNVAIVGLAFLSVGCATAPPDDYGRMGLNYKPARVFGDSVREFSAKEADSFEALTGKAPSSWGRYICHNEQSYNLKSAELVALGRRGVGLLTVIQPGQAKLNSTDPTVPEKVANCVRATISKMRAEINGSTLSSSEKATALRVLEDSTYFLDVEANQKLSAAFLKGLVSGLQADRAPTNELKFGLYLHGTNNVAVGDRPLIVKTLSELGVELEAVWYATYVKQHGFCGTPPYWRDFSYLNPIPAKNLYWQYADDCSGYANFAGGHFDLNVAEPAEARDLRLGPPGIS